MRRKRDGTRAEQVEAWVKMSYSTDCCRDFLCEPVPVRQIGQALQWVEWPGFNHVAIVGLLDLFPADVRVRVGRCVGPLLEFERPGMMHGGLRGMFISAVRAAGGSGRLGYSRMLISRHAYSLLWNDE